MSGAWGKKGSGAALFKKTEASKKIICYELYCYFTIHLQDFFRRITATTTCDVCSHAPTTPPHWSTLRRSASPLSSIDHNHGSILRATSPYPRVTGLEQKTQRESWRRHTSHGVACCDNLASGPEGSMGQYIWGSRHCCPENWTLQSFRLE